MEWLASGYVHTRSVSRCALGSSKYGSAVPAQISGFGACSSPGSGAGITDLCTSKGGGLSTGVSSATCRPSLAAWGKDSVDRDFVTTSSFGVDSARTAESPAGLSAGLSESAKSPEPLRAAELSAISCALALLLRALSGICCAAVCARATDFAFHTSMTRSMQAIISGNSTSSVRVSARRSTYQPSAASACDAQYSSGRSTV